MLKRSGFLWVGILLLSLVPAPAVQAVTISSGGGTITVDDANGMLYDYTVDGQDYVFELENYYRTAAMTQEDGLTGTGAASVVTSVSQTAADTITILGSATGFDFQLDYVVDGARLDSSLQLTNTGGSPLTLSLFAYNDWAFDLLLSDSIGWDGTTLTQSANNAPFRVVRVTPGSAPDAVEASVFGDLSGQLRDAAVTNLTDGGGLPFVGDGTFAMQFDLVIPGGGSTTLDSLAVVPEPETAGLMALGLLGLGFAGRRRD